MVYGSELKEDGLVEESFRDNLIHNYFAGPTSSMGICKTVSVQPSCWGKKRAPMQDQSFFRRLGLSISDHSGKLEIPNYVAWGSFGVLMGHAANDYKWLWRWLVANWECWVDQQIGDFSLPKESLQWGFLADLVRGLEGLPRALIFSCLGLKNNWWAHLLSYRLDETAGRKLKHQCLQ